MAAINTFSLTLDTAGARPSLAVFEELAHA